MDIIVEKLEYDQEIVDYIDSIKYLCSCCVLFPESTNYTMKKLFNLERSEIIGMFRINKKINNTLHRIKSKDKIIVYASCIKPDVLRMQVNTPTCTRVICIEPYSIFIIKCNCDYMIQCISDNDFEIVIFGVRKYE
ncbi:SWPV1-044 [Shearwaterpox virus]|uniref:SWPV1-044 n=1 Tax=Shearwaterpox virus TaxID=1974596 RepID=A0A1V0S7W3_CNPV|nr:SWPV1-044 [Shearwaterpox virus]